MSDLKKKDTEFKVFLSMHNWLVFSECQIKKKLCIDKFPFVWNESLNVREKEDKIWVIGN